VFLYYDNISNKSEVKSCFCTPWNCMGTWRYTISKFILKPGIWYGWLGSSRPVRFIFREIFFFFLFVISLCR